jgi:NAD(P)-dependent dehydrogenase (short-subunit alcohol dehydrogenase family)
MDLRRPGCHARSMTGVSDCVHSKDVVLITGCSSGFGLATAIAFGRAGACVYATVRKTESISKVEAAAVRNAVRLRLVELDVTSGESVLQAVRTAVEDEGRIDVLVNNAGVGRVGPIELLPDELVRETFETNFFGPLRTIRAVLPTMRRQRSGTIVNVSSVAARLWGKPITWAYDASKHALGVMSDALALEVESFGIRVRVIEPGVFATNILKNSTRHQQRDSPYSDLEKAVSRYFDQSAMRAPGPTAVADAIVRATQDLNPFPVHSVVGKDAERLVSAFASATEEMWFTRTRQILKA